MKVRVLNAFSSSVIILVTISLFGAAPRQGWWDLGNVGSGVLLFLSVGAIAAIHYTVFELRKKK